LIPGSVSKVNNSDGSAFGPILARVSFANPALFRLHPGISIHAAALNQDGTINGPDNPASLGSVVSLFVTGIGSTNPSCTTGALNAPGPVNLPPGVTVVLNGSALAGPQVQYAGGAPTLLCGVLKSTC
jgi:uncharacterized protein (TIGR03437 family)